ncbi:hypothetical protein SNE40_009860 [Patella caerulea]|uniref:Serine protease n=1 Tax=Patella caerulea TaxID=87958 RepID=A0AAN8PS90_PATCE
MEVEVATEAYPSIIDAESCLKNHPHTSGFTLFADFKITDLPTAIRSEETMSYLKYLGQTVVRLTVVKTNGQSIFGSGVVYKAAGKYVILTNDHVVSSDNDVKNCSIDFFYHTQDQQGVETSRGVALCAGSTVQDRCFFFFQPIPKAIQEMNIFDNQGLIAMVTVTYEDMSETKSNGYPTAIGDKYFVMVTRSEMLPNKDILTCEITIVDHGQVHPVKFLKIDHVEDKVVCLEVESLPKSVTDTISQTCKAECSLDRRTFVPVVISHPHGGPKMVTTGKMLAVTEKGLVKNLLHTAQTCPGSSGGLVVTVGGNPSQHFGYAANICCHCEGEKAGDFNGVPTETGNLNISIFNN